MEVRHGVAVGHQVVAVLLAVTRAVGAHPVAVIRAVVAPVVVELAVAVGGDSLIVDSPWFCFSCQLRSILKPSNPINPAPFCRLGSDISCGL